MFSYLPERLEDVVPIQSGDALWPHQTLEICSVLREHALLAKIAIFRDM